MAIDSDKMQRRQMVVPALVAIAALLAVIVGFRTRQTSVRGIAVVVVYYCLSLF